MTQILKNRTFTRIVIISALLYLFLILQGCFYHKWSKKQLQNFIKNCTSRKTVTNLSISFIGYTKKQLKSVKILEYVQNKLVDSFTIDISRTGVRLHPYQKGNPETYSVHIGRPLNLEYKYKIKISDEKPYVLKNMKMVVWPMFSMTSQHYGCEMGNFTLDGKQFKQTAGVNIIKRQKK